MGVGGWVGWQVNPLLANALAETKAKTLYRYLLEISSFEALLVFLVEQF